MSNLYADTMNIGGQTTIGTSTVTGNSVVAGNDLVQGNSTVQGLTTVAANTMAVVSLQGSCSFGVITVPVPASGFYQIPVTGTFGQGSFTGSLPLPSLYPGGDIILTDTLGFYPWMLSGTMSSFGSSAGNGGTQALSSSNGTHLAMSAGGTVGFWSDSKSWLVCALSGTATLSK